MSSSDNESSDSEYNHNLSRLSRNPKAFVHEHGDFIMTSPLAEALSRCVLICSRCNHRKQECSCKKCTSCGAVATGKNRTHCRRCFLPNCHDCCEAQQYIHLHDKNPRKVCQLCGLKAALGILPVAPEAARDGLWWGVYILREAAAPLPYRCVMPHAVLTHHGCFQCPSCQAPTVPTASHYPRRLYGMGRFSAEPLQLFQRLYSPTERFGSSTCPLSVEASESIMRRTFPRGEESLAFHGTERPWDILLSAVAASVAYEYDRSPQASLMLSDVPYASLLTLVITSRRFTMLEGPGKTMFFAVPGTHNTRTAIIDIQIGQVERKMKLRRCTCQVSGGVNGGGGGGIAAVSGARGQLNHLPNPSSQSRVWRYMVHKGFADEADQIDLPVNQLLRCVEKGYHIVFCGHSMGGAVAMLLALRLLRKYHNRHVQWCRSRSNIENPAAAASSQEAPSAKEANRLLPLLEQRISCITFGAPLIGNVALRECVNECGWSSCFHHVVTHGDSVPLLTFHKAFKHTKELLRSGSALLNQLSPLANVMERAWSTITGTADTDEWSRARRQRGTRRNGRIIPQGGWGAVLSQLTGNSSPSSSCDADPPSPVGSSPSTSTSSSRSSARSTSISSAVDHEEALRSGVSVFSSPADRMALEGAAALESTTQGSEGVESSSAREDELMFSAGATVAPFSSTASASREPPPLDYQCFGRYHFLRWQDLNYCSSIDHLTTMTILEEGSHGSLKEHHSVYGYNKALMMHLYTSPRPY